MSKREHEDDVAEPISLSLAAREFTMARETMRNRLQRSGAVPLTDGRWRIRDVILAIGGERLPLEDRFNILQARHQERFEGACAQLAAELRALPVIRKHQAQRDSLADQIESLCKR